MTRNMKPRKRQAWLNLYDIIAEEYNREKEAHKRELRELLDWPDDELSRIGENRDAILQELDPEAYEAAREDKVMGQIYRNALDYF